MTDLDPLLREAMARVRGPIDARPSLTDVRRTRPPPQPHRRMAAVGGRWRAPAWPPPALIIRRDGSGRPQPAARPTPRRPNSRRPPTTFDLPAIRHHHDGGVRRADGHDHGPVVWDALSSSARQRSAGVARRCRAAGSAAADDDADRRTVRLHTRLSAGHVHLRRMARDRQEHRLRRCRGDAGDEPEHRLLDPARRGRRAGDAVLAPRRRRPTRTATSHRPTISVTSGVMLIDGGAPAGAMDDAYQRLAGYDRTIVPGTGKTVEQTMVMPIDDNVAMATAVGTSSASTDSTPGTRHSSPLRYRASWPS